MRKVCVVTAALALLGFGIAAQAAITIDTVTVGNAGNTADTTGYGSVGYDYKIGKYEVTAGQYTAFLNAKAKTDSYGLYSTNMSNTSTGCGITRSGVSGSYSYSVASDFVKRPVGYVCFWDACRFVNWLCNGQGTGSTETGAYTLTTSGITNNTVTRNAGWKWAVTNENEWYKAAYYKGGSKKAGYWLYPTSSDTTPGRDTTDASGNNANYYSDTPYPIEPGKYTTEVGEFRNSDSPYGTFDQGGNLQEWNETIKKSGANRGVRGGDLVNLSYNLQSGYAYSFAPTYEPWSFGFRVVQAVPEPSSLIALAGGLISLLGARRHKA